MALNDNSDQGYGQGYGQQGPAQTGPKQTDNPLQSFVDSLPKGKADLKDIANLLITIGELLTKQQASALATRKSYKDHSSELRAQVAFQDEILDSTKKIAEYQKRIQKDGKPPSMAATLRAYREMEKISKAHLEKGMFSKKQTDVMKKNVAEMQAAIKALKANKGDAFDSTELDKYITKLGRLNRDTIGLARNMKGVRLSTLTQDHQSAVNSLNHIFGGKDRTAKYREYAARASKIRSAHQAHVEGKHAHAAARRAEILSDSQAIPLWRLRKKRFQKEDGSFDEVGWKAKRSEIQAAAGVEARNRGMRRPGSRIFAKHAVDTSHRGSSNVMTRMGMNVLARGEGSIGRGVASMGWGAIESGVAGIAERAGP